MMDESALPSGDALDVQHGSEGLLASLHDFQDRFNRNPRAHKLVKSWDREILVEATDTDVRYTMTVEGARLADVASGEPEGRYPDPVHLQSDEETLVEIFRGAYNPSTALLDGVLAVFSSDKDKVKLEALAMVIWGL